MRHVAAAAALASLLAGCTQTASPQSPVPQGSAAPGVTPSNFQLPEGAGCGGDLARFQAVLKNDVEVGHLGQAVYGRAVADLRQAETACQSGRDVQARSILAITRRNYGYPPG